MSIPNFADVELGAPPVGDGGVGHNPGCRTRDPAADGAAPASRASVRNVLDVTIARSIGPAAATASATESSVLST